MKYAVFTVSTPSMTPEEVAPKLKEYGYDGIEWRVVDEKPNPPGMGFWHGNKSTIAFTGLEDSVPRIRHLAEENGLEMPALGTYVRASAPADVEAAMRGAVALGVKRLRVNVARYDSSEPFMPVWNRDREDYTRVAELAQKHGVQAQIEIHHGSVCPSASAARLYVEGMDPEHVGVIHDAGNMVYEGFENYRMGLEMLGPYLAHVHVKNARWFPRKYRDDRSVIWTCDAAPLHRGIAEIRDLFRALKAVGYDGWISVEDFSTERPLDDRLKENLSFLKAVEAEANSPAG
ncbi:MAG TPA: sugar phosphate isomerase/epimerase family protein [Thermomicrobiales bacterium]|nr:sugar phosphate isomerase/epimerase family protein [Thermomicrobiales bacterium]